MENLVKLSFLGSKGDKLGLLLFFPDPFRRLEFHRFGVDELMEVWFVYCLCIC